MMYPWLAKLYSELARRAESEQLHHGILFVADNGVGESALIQELGKALVCETKSACGMCKTCHLFEAQSHPDVKVVVSDKPSIGVDLIRSVSELVSTTAQLQGNKVIIISRIESMTESASNALLKTLEEPTNNTFLLLSTTKPDSVMATIKSRCEKIRLSLPDNKTSMAWLSKNTDKSISEEGLNAYSGSPLLYLAALENSEADCDEFAKELAQLISGNLSANALANKWEKEAQKALKWVYQFSTFQMQKKLEVSTNLEEFTLLSNVANECIAFSDKISQAGINKMLILQRIFNHLKTLS